jgi:hypothetical protein
MVHHTQPGRNQPDLKPVHSAQWGSLERVPYPLGRARSRVRVTTRSTFAIRNGKLIDDQRSSLR